MKIQFTMSFPLLYSRAEVEFESASFPEMHSRLGLFHGHPQMKKRLIDSLHLTTGPNG